MENTNFIKYLDTPEFVEASVNATRLVTKLKSAVQKQELYETHQILRTIYFRFVNSQEKIPALVGLLFEGSCYLLKHHEYVSGQDTATLFLEAAAKQLVDYRAKEDSLSNESLTNPSMDFHTCNNTLDLQIVTKATILLFHLPDTEVGQTKYLAEALKILTPKILNRELLHHNMAKSAWHRKDFYHARYHYLHCANTDNAKCISRLLVECHGQSGKDDEADLFITQFILQFLCLQRPTDTYGGRPQRPAMAPTQGTSQISQRSRSTIKAIALEIFESYCQCNPVLSRSPTHESRSPLLNFTKFVIVMLDSNQDADAFTKLCQIYKIALSRDPKFESYLKRIGTLFFCITDQSKPAQGGFFNNILMSLIDGADDEEEEDTNPTAENAGRSGGNSSIYDELD